MMSEFLIYLLQANLAIILFALIYRVLLSKNTLYSANRFYLLASLLIAVTFQLLPAYQVSGAESMQSSILSIPSSLLSSSKSTVTTSNSHIFWWIAAAVWMAVVAAKIVKLAVGVSTILRIKRQSIKHYYNSEEYYYVHPNIVPFSFFGSIFLPKDSYEEKSDILQHERSHCSNHHSWDLIISELFSILFWYNPASWYLFAQIRDNIEYQADMKTTEGRADKRSYQYQLLEICTATKDNTVATYFNKSNLKKRIMMMNRARSPRVAVVGYTLLPIAILLLSMTNISCTDNNSFSADKVASRTDVSIESRDGSVDVKVVGMGEHSDRFEIPISSSDDQPLVILDGIEQESGVDFNEVITPDKIESISVLKEKSALDIYGQRGKHGVIVITSK